MADPIQEVLQAFAHGELVVVTDDDDREGEGDLIVAASACTAGAIHMFIAASTRTRPMTLPPIRASTWPRTMGSRYGFITVTPFGSAEVS